MGIEEKRIAGWKTRTPIGYDVLYTRMTTDGEEVAATVISTEGSWNWVVTSDAKQVGAGSEVSSELARFKADLKLSEIVDPDNIKEIFILEK